MKTPQLDLLLISPAPIFYAIPLGIMSIASYVRSKGFSVEILVDNIWGLKKRLAKMDLRRTVVGFSAPPDIVEDAIELCDWLKTRQSPEIYCLLGGVHATSMPRETLAASRFDCLVQGEGEATVLASMQSASRAVRAGRTVLLAPGSGVRMGKSCRGLCISATARGSLILRAPVGW